MKIIQLLSLLILPFSLLGQDAKTASLKALEASEDLTRKANKELSNSDFVDAEANFRRATSKSNQNTIAPYNLGNAYYDRESYGEAFGQFKEAGERATDKSAKHKAFHNMGNVFMKKKEYQKAIEAYKEALRNDPTDEESRYNLALAKELGKNQQENQPQNPDQDEDKDQEQEDQEENKEQNQDQNQGDNQDNEDNQDNQDKQQDGDSEKEENKEGNGDQKQEQDRKPEEKEQPQQPRPNQLSPQQIQNLLQAMENEEKKVKEKIDAQKVKGPQIKTEKDW
jgi:tetratricopeptide (TPR) repeat protein